MARGTKDAEGTEDTAMFPTSESKPPVAVEAVGEFDLDSFIAQGGAVELREGLDSEHTKVIDRLTGMGSGVEGSDWWKILQKAIPDPANPKQNLHVPGEYYRGEGGDVTTVGKIIESADCLIGAVPCALPNARSCWFDGADRPSCWSEDGITASYDVPPNPFDGWNPLCEACSQCAANRSDEKGKKFCKTKPRFLMIGVGDDGNLDEKKQIILVASFFSSTIWWDFTKSMRKKGVNFAMFLYKFTARIEDFGTNVSQMVAGINPEIIRNLSKEEYALVAAAAYDIMANKGRWTPPRVSMLAGERRPYQLPPAVVPQPPDDEIDDGGFA
ncbi:MAG: hypothetical protein WC495_03025 [Patescibacteria group bacterium]